jgi:phosphatidylglycerophosphate synthase
MYDVFMAGRKSYTGSGTCTERKLAAMLDGLVRRVVDPAMQRTGHRLAGAGLSANAVTYFGFAAGLAAMSAIAAQYYLAGLGFIAINRMSDGLDGAVARSAGKSDFGGYLDIVLDFAFYGAVPVGFVIADPSANGLAGSVLVLSFYVNGASFLAYSVMAEKRAMVTQRRGEKSIYFTAGLAEATETVAVFTLMCLFPRWFAVFAWLFAVICFYTAFSRIVLARRMFVGTSSSDG